MDSKIFLKDNPKIEKHTFFGRSVGSKDSGRSKLGFTVINKMARFQMLLEKNTPLEKK